MTNTNQASYYNVLVFTIVTGIFSLILLLLLFFEQFKSFITFVITVELGLVTIIIWCIYTIMQASKPSKMPNLIINYGDCPDYYVKANDNTGTPYCNNSYNYIQPNGSQYYMAIYSASNINNPTTNLINAKINSFGQPGPNSANNPTSQTWFPYTDTSIMNANSSDKGTCPNAAALPDLQTKCAILYSDPAQNTTNSYMTGTKSIPWTYMQSRCEAYLPNGGNANITPTACTST